MQNIIDAWGEEGLEDCQAITAQRTELIPENNEAAFIFSRIKKVVYPKGEAGVFDDANIIPAAYMLCFMYGVKNPNETVDKVLEIFANLTKRNVDKYNNSSGNQRMGYVQ